jgi:arylsulfatase A-like enzyme
LGDSSSCCRSSYAAPGSMQKYSDLLLKLLWGAFCVISSCYALLASLPYTYYAFIKAAPYDWMPWFVNHHALLFWAAFAGLVIAYRKQSTSTPFLVCFALLGIVGVYLTVKPLLPALEDDAIAYWTAVIALWPAAAVGALDFGKQSHGSREDPQAVSHLSYATAALLAAGIAGVYAIASRLQIYVATRQAANLELKDVYLTLWSAFSHFVVFVMVFSLLNLIRLAASKTSHPRLWRWALCSFLLFTLLWILVARFLESAFSLRGWQVHVYSASLAAAVTFLGLSLLAPFLLAPAIRPASQNGRRRFLSALGSLVLILVVLLVHAFIGGADWNGFLLGTLALVFWMGFGLCIYRLHRRTALYKLPVVLLVAGAVLLCYAGLQASEILWAKPLGQTDDEVQRSFDLYATHDVSFNLAHNLLGNGRRDPCGEACRVMRAYTNVPNAKATFDLNLVDALVPTRGLRPNIFFIVVDSMRPDYLGIYNAKVRFTPNLDAFAKDSFVIHNAFSPYAGTSLSEPAIWSGALLLHAHYIQPFSRLNSLQKLLRTDGYQMFLSEDEVLAALVPAAPDIVRLDKEKHLWGELELGSTLSQLETALENRPPDAPPVFFYSQPKNVHQFATNKLPTPMQAGWHAIPGFDYRISFEVHQVDEFLGQFFSWLKEHGQYDNSIIIVTSDHGDATGEFGRTSHSLVIYPEIMRVPMIIHLPESLRKNLVYDDSRVSSLTDLTPSLYSLLGHRPILAQPLFGRPLFASTVEELHSYHRDDLFLASDVRAAYGVLADNGRYFYATYDAPPHSYLFDLSSDPNGERDVLTEPLKLRYDREIIDYLQALGNFYGYKPGLTSLSGKERPAD